MPPFASTTPVGLIQVLGRKSCHVVFEDFAMPRFVTIGYGDQEGYERTPENVRDRAHANDALLVRQGAIMGIAGSPTQVRNPEAAGVKTKGGPFMSSPLPIAGFTIIEADNIAAAVEMVAASPCAVAHGVVEVWPLEQPGDAA